MKLRIGCLVCVTTVWWWLSAGNVLALENDKPPNGATCQTRIVPLLEDRVVGVRVGKDFPGAYVRLVQHRSLAEAYKEEIMRLSRDIDQHRRGMNCGTRYLAVAAPTIPAAGGRWQISCYRSANRAVNEALRRCRKNNGRLPCALFYIVRILNHTGRTIQIYIFPPSGPPNYGSEHSLLRWTCGPGQALNLGVDGSFLRVSNNFVLSAEYEDGSRKWNARRIHEYSHIVKNTTAGQQIVIKLVH